VRDVLVVDDDSDIRNLLSEVLDAEGYQVSSVRNGGEALRRIAGQRGPLVVLLDLMMPEVDGYAVLRELARDPAIRSRCRVVVMSASERLHAGGIDGADGALPKPFDLMDLLDTVEVFARDDEPHVKGLDETASASPN
jgi:CheY-like chemotaxis protein